MTKPKKPAPPPRAVDPVNVVRVSQVDRVTSPPGDTAAVRIYEAGTLTVVFETTRSKRWTPRPGRYTARYSDRDGNLLAALEFDVIPG